MNAQEYLKHWSQGEDKERSSMSIEEMVVRLGSKGLLPCEHTLKITQCFNGDWGVTICPLVDRYKHHYAEAWAQSLKRALEMLMEVTNRGADIPPKTEP